MMIKDQIVVIPSYEPDHLMVKLVEDLKEKFSYIIVIDDGSGEESTSYFNQVKAYPEVIFLQHEKNMGKGAALKTAFQYVLEHFSSAKSVVLCDADGQHLPTDILHVSQIASQNPRNFIFGVRTFDRKNTPFRSWLGNTLTQAVLKLVLKTALNDTQTGLRAYPIEYLSEFVHIPYDRYEYDTESIILISKHQWEIQSIPIQTVYIDGNRRSHFNPVLDSLKIYWVIFKFSFISIVSFLIDLGIFSLLTLLSFSTLPAFFISRSISAIFNFIGHRYLTFQAQNTLLKSVVFYVVLWAINIFLGAYLIDLFVSLTHWHKIPTKILTDFILFVLNFLVSKFIVFPSKTQMTNN